MKKIGIFSMLLFSVLLLRLPVSAAEEGVYCFQKTDFAETVTGICLKQIPREGTLMLNGRVLKPGDVLTGEQAASMTYCSYTGKGGEILYLPISEKGVQETARFFIPGQKNQAPVAEDSLLETYQNLPNTGLLRVYDPEQKEVTVTLVREPRRGSVQVEPDGKFTYTPKKNKVGTDSFTYTAQDPEGNVSREAMVTIQILKPSEAAMYRDTWGRNCSFPAEWMKNSGIFRAEKIGDAGCFQPEKPVSRGEFLTMLLKTLGISPEKTMPENLRDLPLWLQPYAAAALRAGITAGLPEAEDWEAPASFGEAAVMIQNALDLPVPAISEKMEVPAWAASSAAALAAKGIPSEYGETLNRGETAELLYSVHLLRIS